MVEHLKGCESEKVVFTLIRPSYMPKNPTGIGL